MTYPTSPGCPAPEYQPQPTPNKHNKRTRSVRSPVSLAVNANVNRQSPKMTVESPTPTPKADRDVKPISSSESSLEPALKTLSPDLSESRRSPGSKRKKSKLTDSSPGGCPDPEYVPVGKPVEKNHSKRPRSMRSPEVDADIDRPLPKMTARPAISAPKAIQIPPNVTQINPNSPGSTPRSPHENLLELRRSIKTLTGNGPPETPTSSVENENDVYVLKQKGIVFKPGAKIAETNKACHELLVIGGINQTTVPALEYRMNVIARCDHDRLYKINTITMEIVNIGRKSTTVITREIARFTRKETSEFQNELKEWAKQIAEQIEELAKQEQIEELADQAENGSSLDRDSLRDIKGVPQEIDESDEEVDDVGDVGKSEEESDEEVDDLEKEYEKYDYVENQLIIENSELYVIRNEQKYSVRILGKGSLGEYICEVTGNNVLGMAQKFVENNINDDDEIDLMADTETQRKKAKDFYQRIDDFSFIECFMGICLLRPQDCIVGYLPDSNILFQKINPEDPASKLRLVLIDLDDALPSANDFEFTLVNDLPSTDPSKKRAITRNGLMGFPQAHAPLSAENRAHIQAVIDKVVENRNNAVSFFNEHPEISKTQAKAYLDMIDKIGSLRIIDKVDSPRDKELTSLKDIYFKLFPEYARQWELFPESTSPIRRAEDIGIKSAGDIESFADRS